MDFINELEKEFLTFANAEKSAAMERYMKNNFLFFGIPMTQRRLILKSVSAKYTTSIKTNTRAIVEKLYEKPQREFHYCAIELLIQHCSKKLVVEDFLIIEKLLLTHSWWDSVDIISKYMLGRYLTQFPEQRYTVLDKFSQASNLWLNRSTIIYQLEYKEHTNFTILKSQCDFFKTNQEFFIKKAIGWALREYSKYNPNEVLHYVSNSDLQPLSKKEALRNIEKFTR